MSYIELKNVTKHFKRSTGERIIGLNNLNLSIQPGEIIGIIGTNGAGKSTLLNCLTGQTPIDSGEIWIGGERVDHLKPSKSASKISRVFQDAGMGTAPRMTVFENLMLAMKRGEKRGFHSSLTTENYKKMERYVSQFKLDLENRLDIEMEALSGGQRQAVALLMATLKQPQLLLLDEHTAALDPRMAQTVMAITQQLIVEQSLTVIMITHRLQDALTYCSRVVAMHQGEIYRIFDREALQSLTTADLFLILEEMVNQ
ncbi:MAG: ATP-binding cassette domain-containing protein [Aerococcaceae bacterium]|nr:ATP-binding cassette domain-containing protein [Aerococcaceae bacterium]